MAASFNQIKNITAQSFRLFVLTINRMLASLVFKKTKGTGSASNKALKTTPFGRSDAFTRGGFAIMPHATAPLSLMLGATMEELKLSHPYWVRIIGWVFLPIMLGVSIWCLFLPVWYQRYEFLLFLSAAFLGGGCLYMTVHGLKTLPFMNAVITLSEKGISVKNGSKCNSVQWSSILKVRHVASAQILHLYDTQGNRFLSVTEQLKGFSILVGCLHDKSGLEL